MARRKQKSPLRFKNPYVLKDQNKPGKEGMRIAVLRPGTTIAQTWQSASPLRVPSRKKANPYNGTRLARRTVPFPKKSARKRRPCSPQRRARSPVRKCSPRSPRSPSSDWSVSVMSP